MTLSINSVVLFRIININKVIRGMFRIFHQTVSGKLGQSFLEDGLHSVILLLLVSILNRITVVVFTDETEQICEAQNENSQVYKIQNNTKKSAVINVIL